MMKCLLCYKPLSDNKSEYHTQCIIKTFGLKEIPSIDFDENKLATYAKEILGTHQAIPGVQPKLSIWLEENRASLRFTIIDGKSNYIMKPQSEIYEALPENEDLCMHIANEIGINVAKHGLVRLKSGALAYITKRFDRSDNGKIACEDLCQLTETLTEHKDRGSYEKASKAIKLHSTQAGLDIFHYFELIVFSFITANADMHLKNFSMFEKEYGQFVLSPAYDLVCTALAIKNEEEQMMLTLNGRKNKLVKKDFVTLANNLSLSEKQQQSIFSNFSSKLEDAIWWIDNSFLPHDHKELLKQIMIDRVGLLNS